MCKQVRGQAISWSLAKRHTSTRTGEGVRGSDGRAGSVECPMWDGRVTPAVYGLLPAHGGCLHAPSPSSHAHHCDCSRGECSQRDVHREGDIAAVRRPNLPPCAACAELGTVDDGHLAGICGGETRGGDFAPAALAALFSLRAWRWRHWKRDGTQRSVGGVERHGRTRVQKGGARRKPVYSRLTAAAVYIMCWAATTNMTTGSHSPAESIFGQGTCAATGSSHFEVKCTASGLYSDLKGRSAFKRCAPILCPPFKAPEFSVVVPLLGADPAKMKLGDELEVKCNAGYVYRKPAGYSGVAELTNRSQCTRSPVCQFTPTLICVYDTVGSGCCTTVIVCMQTHACGHERLPICTCEKTPNLERYLMCSLCAGAVLPGGD